MKRRLKIAALSFGLFVLLVLSFLGWIIYTEAGLQFAVSRLPEKLGRVTLRIEDVRGTIAGGFRAVRVDVNHERSHVYIENASARVNFWPLLVGRISVRRWWRSSAGFIHRPTRRPGSCRGCSASAPSAPLQRAWSSSRPMANAWNSAP